MSRLGVMLAVGAIAAAAVGTSVGAADADAVVGPRLAVSSSGVTDWQITFDRGDNRAASCELYVGNMGLRVGPSGTTTLRGSMVRAGRHDVRMRCGRQMSPTIRIYAPRGQLNDVATWGSNFTAGVLGF